VLAENNPVLRSRQRRDSATIEPPGHPRCRLESPSSSLRLEPFATRRSVAPSARNPDRSKAPTPISGGPWMPFCPHLTIDHTHAISPCWPGRSTECGGTLQEVIAIEACSLWMPGSPLAKAPQSLLKRPRPVAETKPGVAPPRTVSFRHRESELRPHDQLCRRRKLLQPGERRPSEPAAVRRPHACVGVLPLCLVCARAAGRGGTPPLLLDCRTPPCPWSWSNDQPSALGSCGVGHPRPCDSAPGPAPLCAGRAACPNPVASSIAGPKTVQILQACAWRPWRRFEALES